MSQLLITRNIKTPVEGEVSNVLTSKIVGLASAAVIAVARPQNDFKTTSELWTAMAVEEGRPSSAPASVRSSPASDQRRRPFGGSSPALLTSGGSSPALDQLVPTSDQLVPASDQLVPAPDQLVPAPSRSPPAPDRSSFYPRDTSSEEQTKNASSANDSILADDGTVSGGEITSVFPTNSDAGSSNSMPRKTLCGITWVFPTNSDAGSSNSMPRQTPCELLSETSIETNEEQEEVSNVPGNRNFLNLVRIHEAAIGKQSTLAQASAVKTSIEPKNPAQEITPSETVQTSNNPAESTKKIEGRVSALKEFFEKGTKEQPSSKPVEKTTKTERITGEPATAQQTTVLPGVTPDAQKKYLNHHGGSRSLPEKNNTKNLVNRIETGRLEPSKSSSRNAIPRGFVAGRVEEFNNYGQRKTVPKKKTTALW